MDTKLTSFPCTSCGECCRRVYLSPDTQFLDRGDGVCLHFDDKSNLCLIYKDRPLVCRVEDYYQQNLSQQISWGEFVQINLGVCKKFQE